MKTTLTKDDIRHRVLGGLQGAPRWRDELRRGYTGLSIDQVDEALDDLIRRDHVKLTSHGLVATDEGMGRYVLDSNMEGW